MNVPSLRNEEKRSNWPAVDHLSCHKNKIEKEKMPEKLFFPQWKTNRKIRWTSGLSLVWFEVVIALNCQTIQRHSIDFFYFIIMNIHKINRIFRFCFFWLSSVHSSHTEWGIVSLLEFAIHLLSLLFQSIWPKIKETKTNRSLHECIVFTFASFTSRFLSLASASFRCT